MTSSGRPERASPLDGVSPTDTRSQRDAHLSPGLGMQDYVDVEDTDLSGELIRRLRHLEHFVSPEQMGEIWIFPPLEETEGTREFVLFTRMTGEDERHVFSARDRRNGQGTDDASGRDRGPATNGASAPAAAGGNGDASGPAASANGEGASGNGASSGGAQAIVEHGRAPAGRLPGLVERLLRRLGDQRAPVHVAVEGSRARWDELVTRLAQEAGAAGN